MEDNFNQNDFEAFLKEQVRNHRMYPTDAVWRDIIKKLHGNKKWPGLTIAAFIILSATIAISVYFTPKPDIFAINSSVTKVRNAELLIPQHNISLSNLTSSPSHNSEKNITAAVGKTQKNIVLPNVAAITDNEVYKQNNNEIVKKKTAKTINRGNIASRNSVVQQLISSPVFNVINNNAEPKSNDEAEIQNNLETSNPLNKKIETSTIRPFEASTKVIKDYNDKNMVDSFLKDHKNDISLHTKLPVKSLKNKFGFQIYIAPSISYRKLVEDPSVLKEGSNTGPVGLNYVADVNEVVRHKPGNGLEAGINIMYYLSENFRIKSGFQFNVRQYTIEAYRSGTELASIALVENNRIDTVVNMLSYYRNSNGYYSAELVNRYYQLSIPIGIEWEVIGNKRVQLNVAGSIQPTYLINHNAYLISTNFKNYSENPDMVRSFNVNSNIEAFISFKVGNYKWQIGPQLRYQPYSTFIPQYPIKEHLLDYGIKLGLSKTFH